ncbi:MAG TPA: efflux RND transporter periplasmic adaptor subunit [Terriglobales bacterium]
MNRRLQPLWTRRTPLVIAGIVAACILLLGAIRYSRHGPAVPTIDVKRGEFLDSFQIRGEVAALKSIEITAPAEAGDLQVLKLVSDGAKVKPGDSIVVFDKTKTEQDLAQDRSSLKYATADIEQARAQARLTEEQDLTAVSKARFDLQSAELDASKQEIVSRIEGAEAQLKVDDAKQALREAEQKLKSDRAANQATIAGKIEACKKAAFDVQRAETALSKMELRAPAAGMVSLVPVWGPAGPAPAKAGDRAWPGEILAELPDTSSLRVTARVDETERGHLAQTQPVTVHLDAIPDKQFSGKVDEISTIASEDYTAGWPIPRDFDLRITLDQIDPRLRPGLTAQITIVVERIPDVIVIPVQATFQKEGETFAYVWNGSRFREQPIEVTRRSGDRVVVAKGLQAADRIALQDPATRE